MQSIEQIVQPNMKLNSSTYLLELYVKKCRIKVSEAGNVGLLLRAGKSQSQVTDMKPIIKGVINFNTSIKLNIDQSALDTQRCSLTLNFVSAQSSRRVIGIVVITLPGLGEEVQRAFKVTSTPDKDAEIELSISLNELDEHMRVKQKSKIKHSQKPKQLQKDKKQPDTQHTKKQPDTQPFRSISSELLLMTTKGQQQKQKPTSPPSESTQKLNLKSKRSQLECINSYEEFMTTVQKLQREKDLLKQLLRIQMAKSSQAQTHLKNIIEILQLAVGINVPTLPQDTPFKQAQSSLIKKTQTLDFNKLSLSLTSPGLHTSSRLNVFKESLLKNQAIQSSESKMKSQISFGSQNSVHLMGVLNSLKKKMQENGMSKNQMNKLFDTIKNEPCVDLDSKLRSLKTKIDRSYLGLMSKQVTTKEQILKHKIQINKIIDETINPVMAK